MHTVHICIFILPRFAWQNGPSRTATGRSSRSWRRPEIATRIRRRGARAARGALGAYLYLYIIPLRVAKRRPEDCTGPFLNKLKPARKRDVNKAAWCTLYTLCIFVSLSYFASHAKSDPLPEADTARSRPPAQIRHMKVGRHATIHLPLTPVGILCHYTRTGKCPASPAT